jgi:hypothetical protein
MIAAGHVFVERSLQGGRNPKWLGCIDHLHQLDYLIASHYEFLIITRLINHSKVVVAFSCCWLSQYRNALCATTGPGPQLHEVDWDLQSQSATLLFYMDRCLPVYKM